MPDFAVDSFLLVRSPAYSYQNFSLLFLQKVLKTDFFKASLFFASQTLYLELKKKCFDYDQLDEHAKITLWKYLNRMCFRPLPYGLFSSFSLAGWTFQQENPLRLNGKGQLTAIPDFVSILNYIDTLKLEELSNVRYYTNNSMYTTAGELYFVSQAYSEQDKHVIVHLKVIPGLKKLLRFIDQGQTKGAILNYLVKQYGEDAGAEDYFNHLVKGQVIVSELMPNVTGVLYNERCLTVLKEYPNLNLDALKTFSAPINDQSDALSSILAHIEEISGRNEYRPPYSLYQREVTGGLNSEVHPEFISLIKSLDKLTVDRSGEVMKEFKIAFKKKYERREVPLMEVMDPGIGIGYDNLTAAFDNQNNGFIDDLRKPQEPESRMKWGEAEKMIFKKWTNLSKSGSDKIILTPEDINSLPESKSMLPPGMSILYKNVDQELWIDQISGASGIELGARFGAPNGLIEKQLKNICEQEMAVNNDFIFAEISFSPPNKASNIKQRGHFYPYEIPILTHSARSEESTIKLNDLMISMNGNTIMLRSVKLNKYVIPRLSSVYNVQLTTIPAFRFLCDLQHQGIKTNLGFSLEQFFPGLDYYPRVQLDKAVLSAARWILDETKIKRIVEGNFKDVQQELLLPVYFSWYERDNFLVFNTASTDDIDMFKRCIRNKKSITLREYVFPKYADLHDFEKRPYASQFIACVVNKSKSYALPDSISGIIGNTKKLKVKRSFFLGDEWLYFKLYAHNSFMDSILIHHILPIIRKYKENNPEFKWFFIRYNDPDHHIRLRFFTAKESAQNLFTELSAKLKPLHQSGKIQAILMDTYQRELERYSAELIDDIESLFYLDSDFILDAIQTGGSEVRFKLNFAVHSTLFMVKCLIKDKKERIEFLGSILAGFSAEFNDSDKEIIRKMDFRYRNFQSELIENEQFSVQRKNKAYPYFNQLLILLHEKISNWKLIDKYNLISSLIHMHINRIFETDPRSYEYLAYHFMKKHQAYLNYTTNDEF
ncbi:thiopeptide-type bacteriocin biosynthesis protein [Pedobacter cryoconitis]|uniref:Thiopeptide-type bacteriocin biosynthesis protein n=1 Tax=Pedobacter cryoconitis TaxID=188932 RepID=A0A7W8ZQ42_9SPHI|nr:lantibiotic dehydratase [Pedobacter cryoconitis]MBB5637925.1 thiopeptide-type bacteriocin biosynthesis protein [Pedobacter cryoconitis]